jgi:hypothetical protein
VGDVTETLALALVLLLLVWLLPKLWWGIKRVFGAIGRLFGAGRAQPGHGLGALERPERARDQPQ